ncbi:MAG: hypothetical protein H6Q89_2537 [Myxococcaceae bacterium]|nr:hypothetical protein [Myxococcaceae bacterium]
MWETWSKATCWPDACFCEGIREGLIGQPANTWSSLAFCGVGVLIAAEQLGRRGTASRGMRVGEAYCLAAAAFLLGATSAFYHASLTFLGQWLDVQSMYLLGLLALAVNLDALRPGQPRRFLWTYVGLNLALGVLLVEVPALRRFAFGGVLAAILASEVLLRRRGLRDWSLRPLVAATGVQGFAFGIWTLDLTHVVCDPNSLLQGHAVWHALGAVASWLLWRYYAGDRSAAS